MLLLTNDKKERKGKKITHHIDSLSGKIVHGDQMLFNLDKWDGQF